MKKPILIDFIYNAGKSKKNMSEFKFSLSKRGKVVCPACGHRSFVLYIDNNTGDPLSSTVGKCDRADNCGHHCSPKQFFADNNISFENEKEYVPCPAITAKPQPKPQPSYIDEELMNRTLTGYDSNHFIQYLRSIVGDEAANEAAKRYYIGSAKNGGTVFWQIDQQGKVRAGKIIVYGSDGHRRKDITPPVQWVHSVLKLPDFHLSQCLFGSHLLLTDKHKPVAIVESEKTAVIASCYLPGFIWLACGGCGNLSMKLCESLLGGSVVLFPDAGKYDDWRKKAKELSEICSVSVSSLIEEKATEQELQAGFDLADYLVRFSPSEFAGRKQSESDECHAAYVTSSGVLYIPTPPDRKTTYTVYRNVDFYNKRLELPTFAPVQSVDISRMNRVLINPNTLTI